MSGELEAAESLYTRLLEQSPRHSEALNNLGAILAGRGKRQQALALLERAVEVSPRYGEALNNLGLLHNELGDHQRSFDYFRRACDLDPRDSHWLNNLGNACCELKRFGEALDAYERAIARKPVEAKYWSNRGIALRGLHRPAEAIESFEKAIELDAAHVNAWSNMGSVFKESKLFDRAVAAFERALAIDPRNPAVITNIGTVYEQMGYHERMLALGRQAIEIDPTYAEGHILLANYELEAGDYTAAEAYYERARELDPANRNANWNLAIIWLLRGDFARGWPQFEWRRRLQSIHADHGTYAGPEWDGAPLAGRTILLATEQGIGDAIQFIRYASMLKQAGAAHVIVECPYPIAPLLNTAPGVDQAVARGAPLPAYDTWTNLMSLPFLMGTTLETIPADVPYICAEPRPAANEVSAVDGVLKVGIVWAGNPMHQRDFLRSVDLSRFLPLVDIPGTQFYSLQKGGQGERELASLGDDRIIDLAPHLNDFRDTAAVIDRLDLVITVDTSVAHLAAAMGKSTWVLLTHVPDYRWLLERADSPWYPTARLFRQPRPRDWDSVFVTLGNELRQAASSGVTATLHENPAPPQDAAMVTTLESATRFPDGRARFDLWIPLARLADPRTFAQYEAELVGDGHLRALREFWDAAAHTVDVVVHLTPGLGMMILSLTTTQRPPTRIVAVESNEEEASRLRALVRGRALGERVTIVSTIAEAVNGLRGMQGRIGVHADDSATLREFIAECRGLQPSVAVDLITCARSGDGIAPAWRLVPAGDDKALFSVDFVDGETRLDPVTAETEDVDVAWISDAVLDTLCATAEQATLPVTEPQTIDFPAASSAPKVTVAPVASISREIGIEWELRSDTGWGVYGTNIALELLKHPDYIPAVFSADLQVVGPMAAWRLSEVLRDCARRRAEINAATQPIRFDGLMLRGYGNNMAGSPLWDRVHARRNAGVIFFEDAQFDRAAVDLAHSLDLIVAGSTWNATVLREHGLTNVTTIFQGIDPTIFHPAPRSGLLADRFVIFSGGKLEYRKGQDIVVAAFRRFRERHPEALLVTAWHNNWPHLVSDLELAGHVRGVPQLAGDHLMVREWLAANGVPLDATLDVGRVPNSMMGAVVREADVALFTNRCEGGTNLVAMECMASGVPTIVSANTGHLDLVATDGCLALISQSTPPRPVRHYRSIEGWGESNIDEVVELLEAVHADRSSAGAVAALGAAKMQDWTWSRQIGRLVDSLRVL